MKPTIEQKQWLKDYLRKVMKYRETYEEVYDHMLLAIENHPEQQYFATVVLDILDKDFGGSNGLLALEENCRQAVEATAQAQFRDNFKRWFLSPLVLITAAFFMGLFYMQLPNVKTNGALIFLFLALLALPTIICSVRAAQLGYKYGESKTSIKDEVFRRLAFTSYRVLLKIFFTSGFVQLITKYVFILNDYLAITISLLLIMMYVLPAIKQFRLRRQNGEGFKFFPISRSLVSMRLFTLMLTIDLVNKYVLKTYPLGSEKSMGPNGMYVLYGIVTGVLVLMIINALAVIKLYQSEFKTNMLIN